MSNEHYDEFCLGVYPDLTQLERQILGHYSARFNESVSPARAWPSLSELLRITGVHPKSISRAVTKLVKLGYLYRVTHASKERGRKAELGVNRKLIRERQVKVTGELPNIQDVTHLQVTDASALSNATVQLGNSKVLDRSPGGYPKPKEPIKPINVDRFHLVILNSLPERLRTLSPGANYERLLDECDELGITDEVRRVLATNKWDNVQANAGGIVNKLIKESIERKRLGQAVIASEQVTYVPPRFEPENREITPRSPETDKAISELWRKFGKLPE